MGRAMSYTVNISRNKNTTVPTLMEAGAAVGRFTLGKRSSAWTGTGEVRRLSDGVLVARVSFNGRVWANDGSEITEG